MFYRIESVFSNSRKLVIMKFESEKHHNEIIDVLKNSKHFRFSVTLNNQLYFKMIC